MISYIVYVWGIFKDFLKDTIPTFKPTEHKGNSLKTTQKSQPSVFHEFLTDPFKSTEFNMVYVRAF